MFHSICIRKLDCFGCDTGSPNDSFPKQVCFSWLEETQSTEGPLLRHQDHIADNVNNLGIPNNWHPMVQMRLTWRAAYSTVAVGLGVLVDWQYR